MVTDQLSKHFEATNPRKCNRTKSNMDTSRHYFSHPNSKSQSERYEHIFVAEQIWLYTNVPFIPSAVPATRLLIKLGKKRKTQLLLLKYIELYQGFR